MASTSTTPPNRPCSVPGCLYQKINYDKSVFELPKDSAKAQCWLDRICLNQLPSSKLEKISVCEDHFEKELVNKANTCETRLCRDAVPTLNLPQYDAASSKTYDQPGLETELLNKRKKCENNLSESEVGIPKRKIKNEPIEVGDQDLFEPKAKSPLPLLMGPDSTFPVDSFSNDSNKLANTEEVIGTDSLHQTSQEIDTSIKTDLHLYNPINHTSSYILHLHNIFALIERKAFPVKARKQLFLKLYLSFPNEYKTLYKAFNGVHISELKDVFNDSLITTDRRALFSKYLKVKASYMAPEQKQCFLSIGEYKLKPRLYYDTKQDYLLGLYNLDQVLKPEPATTAVVLIMQGIFNDWKQPIDVAYLGSNSTSLKTWVETNIKKMTVKGFDIRAVVPHKDTNHITNDLTVASNVIYCIHDISALFISLYYHFTKFNLVYSISDKNMISCQYVLDCFELEKNNTLMSKLTNDLLKPASIRELNIESVMNVFSQTTAAVIASNIDSRVLDESAKETVEFIIKMNKLYDILNAGHNNNKKGFVGDTEKVCYLQDMLKFLSNLELNTNSDTASITAFKILIKKFKTSIISVLSLFNVLKKDNYDYLPIWRFTDNAINKFHDQVKKMSKSITKPTAKDVDSIFKQTAVIHFLKNHAKKIKPNNLDTVLTEFGKIASNFKPSNDHVSREPSTNCTISSSDYNSLDMERNDGIIFLAGFILKKSKDLHRCKISGGYDLEALSMCDSIMPEVSKNICAVPGPDFVEFVEMMEISFRTFMNKDELCAPNKRIIIGLLKDLEAIPAQMPCSCFPITYAKNLFMRFRLYHTLKYNNELLKTKLRKRIIVNPL